MYVLFWIITITNHHSSYRGYFDTMTITTGSQEMTSLKTCEIAQKEFYKRADRSSTQVWCSSEMIRNILPIIIILLLSMPCRRQPPVKDPQKCYELNYVPLPDGHYRAEKVECKKNDIR